MVGSFEEFTWWPVVYTGGLKGVYLDVPTLKGPKKLLADSSRFSTV